MHYPALTHGFLAFGGILPAAREACLQLADAVREALHQAPAAGGIAPG